MNGLSNSDILYIRRCLQLARNGCGSTSPNPKVGAVIVCNERIIGEGYHIRAGEPHAEVNAVRSVKECDIHLLKHSTIYVSLEPCSHYGKTPPCCDLIISCGIPRVVVATTDVNSQVNGEGIARMRDAGIDVTVGVLRDEALTINKEFFTYHSQKRPYVILKWAQTSDGFIDVQRSKGEPLKISTNGSQVAVHKLRSECDAIIVGTRTALLDNPSLTIRAWCGRQPLRLVIDRSGKLPNTLRLFNGEYPTIVYTERKIEGKFGKNVEQIVLDFSFDILPQILSHMHSLKVNSLLVEGGAFLLQRFIDSGLWDMARVERNENLILGSGIPAPILQESLKTSSFDCFNNEISIFVRQKSAI
ncbi:MAG: bifunctional diaminohydroxyphosphoribosylaminopyrimidine deaminase/5-amino-6-(5-phosphoribosylamino)uracil reductase RibD [Bacteroidaceae bacterium]|nr:bifunctional diaminohydroxyphosphoribosylaminopyrimidine deaminase/5-amino-6-(5-phosphoribosylamino)uracil reductase RibD [Bacteroidaceae bacterium]